MALLATAAAQVAPQPAELDALARDLEDPAARPEAIVALTRAGAAGAAAIGSLLGSGEMLADEAVDAACSILESLGPDAAGAVPGVAELFYTTAAGSQRARATRCLAQIGAFNHDARDDWHERLKQSNNQTLSIEGFFLTVGAMKADGQNGTVDQLVEGLNDANAYVRFGAALVIGAKSSSWSAAERKTLIAALEADLAVEDRPDSFRMKWLWGTGEASTSGSVSERDLARIRRRTQWALAKLSPPHPQAALGHTLDFAHTDPGVARRAIQMVMTTAEPGDADVVQALVDALRGGRPSVAREAAIALGIVGRGSDHARRALQEVVDDSDQEALVECARAALNSLAR